MLGHCHVLLLKIFLLIGNQSMHMYIWNNYYKSIFSIWHWKNTVLTSLLQLQLIWVTGIIYFTGVLLWWCSPLGWPQSSCSPTPPSWKSGTREGEGLVATRRTLWIEDQAGNSNTSKVLPSGQRLGNLLSKGWRQSTGWRESIAGGCSGLSHGRVDMDSRKDIFKSLSYNISGSFGL